MAKVKMSKYDLLDKFEAYQWNVETTHKDGHQIKLDVVAMLDVEKIIDELIEKLGNGKNFISSND